MYITLTRIRKKPTSPIYTRHTTYTEEQDTRSSVLGTYTYMHMHSLKQKSLQRLTLDRHVYMHTILSIGTSIHLKLTYMYSTCMCMFLGGAHVSQSLNMRTHLLKLYTHFRCTCICNRLHVCNLIGQCTRNNTSISTASL